MSNLEGLSLLENLLISAKALKEEDKHVISTVCRALSINQEAGFINDQFRTQVQLEAYAIYLTSKYGALVDRWRRITEKHKAEKLAELGSRDLNGLKYTKEGKEQQLLVSDAKYIVLSESATEAERLYFTLKNLSDMIFSRDKKLEQLSINFRREMQADTRTS